MINPNQLGRRPFPASASQWMLVGLRGTPPPSGLSDGDPVSSWTDSSGNGHTATQTGTARPTFKTNILNGKPVLRFTTVGASGLNFTPAISGAAPWAIFVVMKATGTTTAAISISTNGSGSFPVGPFDNSDGTLYIADQAGYQNGVGDYSSAYHVFAANRAAGVGIFRVDGTVLTLNPNTPLVSAGNFNNIGYNGFSPSYSDADIAELIIYNVSVTTTDRANIEAYLGAKYAIGVAGGSAVQPDTVSGLQAWWKADSLL